MKIDVFDYPTVVWRPLSREPLWTCAQTLCRQKLESMSYIFAADSMGLSSFKFLWWAPKDASFLEQNAYRRSRSSKVVDFGTNRKGMCDFLLVINSINFGPISHRLWDTATYWLKIANFSYLTLIKRPHRSGWSLSNFWTKLTALLYDENCMILTSTVFAWITVWRTDGRTEGRNCDSIYTLSIYVVARKKLKTHLFAVNASDSSGWNDATQIHVSFIRPTLLLLVSITVRIKPSWNSILLFNPVKF